MLVLPCRTVLGFSNKMGQEHIPILCTLQSRPRFSRFSKLPAPSPVGFAFSSSHKDANGNVVNEYTFTYDITKSGDITILTAEGDTLEGSISIDKKAITLFDALRVKGPGAAVCPWWSIICTATRTLIKVHN